MKGQERKSIKIKSEWRERKFFKHTHIYIYIYYKHSYTLQDIYVSTNDTHTHTHGLVVVVLDAQIFVVVDVGNQKSTKLEKMMFLLRREFEKKLRLAENTNSY